jgi:hypothetical protein
MSGDRNRFHITANFFELCPLFGKILSSIWNYKVLTSLTAGHGSWKALREFGLSIVPATPKKSQHHPETSPPEILNSLTRSLVRPMSNISCCGARIGTNDLQTTAILIHSLAGNDNLTISESEILTFQSIIWHRRIVWPKHIFKPRQTARILTDELWKI